MVREYKPQTLESRSATHVKMTLRAINLQW